MANSDIDIEEIRRAIGMASEDIVETKPAPIGSAQTSTSSIEPDVAVHSERYFKALEYIPSHLNGKVDSLGKAVGLDLFTVVFGFTGIQRLIVGDLLRGLLYFCTFGLFGIGWIFDIVAFFKMHYAWYIIAVKEK